MVLAAVMVSCTYNKTVDEAIQLYQARNYPEALADLKTVEGNESGLNMRWYTRYLAFRGLAHFRAYRQDGSVADRDAAWSFLSKGIRQYERGDRAYLSVQEERELHLARDTLKNETAGTDAARR